MTNIAINGIGRIGKLVLKLLVSNDYKVTYLKYYWHVYLFDI